MICEDILFDPPTGTLVHDHNIDTMLFPTEWWDLLPHQMPTGLMQAYSMGLQVNKTPIFIASFCLRFLFQINWLGSNFHDKHTSCSGSAILTTEGVLSQFHDSGPTSGGKLIMAELPVKPTKYHVDWTKFALENADKFPKNGARFKAVIYGDDYDFVELDPTKNSAKICNGKNPRLCCLAEYDYEEQEVDGLFSLGVFEGNHTEDGSTKGSMGFAVCTILKCSSQNPSNCHPNVG